MVINQNTLNQLHKYGGKELIKSVLEEFDQETSDYMKNLKQNIIDQDYEEIRGAMHTIKGNAGTLGIEKLAKKAERIEKRLKANIFDKLEEEIEKLEYAIEQHPSFLHVIPEEDLIAYEEEHQKRRYSYKGD